jgi:hypothetical protein
VSELVRKVEQVPRILYKMRLPGAPDTTLELSFSVRIPNLDEAVRRFAEAVWEGADDEEYQADRQD